MTAPSSNPVDRERASFFVLTLLNVLLGWVIGYRYISLAGSPNGFAHGLFLFTAVFGQIALGFCIVGFGLTLPLRFAALRRALVIAAAPIFGILFFLLLLDVAVFGHFRFHFNGFVWQIVTTPTVRDALEIPVSDLTRIGVIGAAILVAEGMALHAIRTWLAHRVRPRWRPVLAVVAVMVVTHSSIYAVADITGAREIVRSARAVPLYQRLTIRHATMLVGITPKKMSTLKTRVVSDSARTLQYPRAPLTFKAPEKLPNVVWINLEGFRWDMFNEETTPNLHAWSKNEQVFDYHLSGGNRTATGVFSMFYGIYANYWDTMLSERRSPVMMSRMKQLGYRIQSTASREIGFIDVRNSVFSEMPETHRDTWPMESPHERDAYASELFKKFAKEPGTPGQPFFAWMLLDSSHVTYDFPPEYGKFEPYAREVHYREIGISETRQVEARNRYRNALAYEDHVVGEMLDWMAKQGLMENTVVIVTGDHGEEFYEHGYWSHGAGCTPEVVRVPLVVHIPGKAQGTYSYVTGHQDLVPTLMEMFGVENKAEDYTVGRNLFGDERVPHVVACGWDQSALVDESGWLIFGNDFQNPWDYEVRDPQYVEIKDERGAIEARTSHVASALKNMNAFLK